MTWGGGRPHPVGDKGQRYEITYAEDGARKVLGWSETLAGAERMCRAVHSHPVWTDAKIRDRHINPSPAD